MNSRNLALLVVVLLAAAAGAGWLALRARPQPLAGQPVPGGDGGGLPRATAEDEGLEPAGLEAARSQARALGARALLVMRHGHLVLEDAHALPAGELVPGGAMGEGAQALLAGVATRELGITLPAGELAPAQLVAGIEHEGKQPYARYLSHSIWQPVNAAPALLVGDAAASVQGCCLAARATDWLRIAALLLEGGRFEGTQVVSAAWVQGVLRPLPTDPARAYGLWLAPAASGAEPFAAPDVAFLRGPGRTRLWLMPTLDLAVLLVDDTRAAPDTRFDETRIPNLVIRALHGQQQRQAQGLDALVPGH